MRKKDFEALLAKYEPEIRRAFLASIAEIVSKIVIRDVASALQAGDIERAITALHVEPAAYEAFRAVRGEAYVAGGQVGVVTMPKPPGGPALVVRFDARSPGAENWLGAESSRKISGVYVQEEIQSIRNVLVSGMESGRGPVQTALDIAGRIDPRTGKRTGGLLGLTGQQKEFVARAREELSDPATMTNFLERTRRDRRYDKLIREALRDERALTEKEITSILGRYSDRLLQLRAETVARTESMGALHAGNRQAYAQAVSEGSLRADEVKRFWDDTGDRKTRPSHRAIAQETKANPIGFNDPYVSPSGATLMFPGDPNAPADEIINCRCNEIYRIDFLGRARRELARLRAEAV